MTLRRNAWQGPLLVSALAVSSVAQAFSFDIQPGSRMLYLRIGQGAYQRTGNNFTLGDDATVNELAVVVPAAAVGNAVPQAMAMTTADNQPSETCLPSEVVVGVLYRRGNNGAVATLTATAGVLSSGTGTIPFSQIGWTSSSGGLQAMASGSFTGTAQAFPSLGANTYFESCLTFRYLNSAMVGAGTYSGSVTYTLSAP
jgi:hypothetical protein